jgi:hypothetical protein
MEWGDPSRFLAAVLHLVIFLPQAVGARITLLDFVELLNLDYPLSKLIDQNWGQFLDTDTPQGHNLKLVVEEINNT